MQEAYYDEDVDYRFGSPHLTHWTLYDRLVSRLRVELQNLSDSGLPSTALEAGAGHGGFTEPVLASGAKVTAVEMSEASVGQLKRRFGRNPQFSVRHSPDGSLEPIGDRYSLVLAVAVLHHIPDYVQFLQSMARSVSEGGSLVTFQDPLWYPRYPAAHRADRAAYLVWRLAQGNLRGGLRTRLRWMRSGLDESIPNDMVEYHVVRQGVDEEAVLLALTPYFTSVRLITYWSNQLGIGQRAGDRLGLANTFGVFASGRTRYDPSDDQHQRDSGVYGQTSRESL
jgi:SAM-dependent methyltransferase